MGLYYNQQPGFYYDLPVGRDQGFYYQQEPGFGYGGYDQEQGLDFSKLYHNHQPKGFYY